CRTPLRLPPTLAEGDPRIVAKARRRTRRPDAGRHAAGTGVTVGKHGQRNGRGGRGRQRVRTFPRGTRGRGNHGRRTEWRHDRCRIRTVSPSPWPRRRNRSARPGLVTPRQEFTTADGAVPDRWHGGAIPSGTPPTPPRSG